MTHSIRATRFDHPQATTKRFITQLLCACVFVRYDQEKNGASLRWPHRHGFELILPLHIVLHPHLPQESFHLSVSSFKVTVT